MDSKEYFLSVGKYIADKRKDKNLTQADCCRVTGISKSTMSDMEKGIRLPNVKDMLLLCGVLDITPNDVLSYGSDGYCFSHSKSDEEKAKEDLLLLMKTFSSFLRLSRQSKYLVSSQIYRIAEDENGPSYVKDMEKFELMSSEFVGNKQFRKIVFDKVNLDRRLKDLEPLGEDEVGTAMKEFFDMFIKGMIN